MCFGSQTTSNKPSALLSGATSKAAQVAARLEHRSADAIRGKKGRDVADTFAFAASIVNSNGANVDALVANFVDGYTL